MKKCLLLIFINSFCYQATAQSQYDDIQYWRPYDQNGINIFETDVADTILFEKIKVRLGGNFTQQFQYLEHSNNADPVLNQSGLNVNQLKEIGPGFNLATANLNLDVQLADGIRMNLVTYLSSRNHPETWVKGGFLQIDKLSVLNIQAIDKIMENITIRVGHMEINYGDAHFRRTDNGNAFYNPFVGNYLMDAFTTEIGSEIYFRYKGFIVMAAMTGGEIRGEVANPGQRAPSFYGKIGSDIQFADDLRIRITGSVYHTERSVNNTLFFGDRAGSRYYQVMESQFAGQENSFTGRINPGLRDKVTAFVINPFIKFHSFELFGIMEQARGRSNQETESRLWRQIGGDLLFRFGNRENFYVAGRYNLLQGRLLGNGDDVNISRIQAGGGWFITKNILAKAEYVIQQYNGYGNAHILNGGRFNGLMLEGAIAF